MSTTSLLNIHVGHAAHPTEYEWHHSYSSYGIIWDVLSKTYLGPENQWQHPKWWGDCQPLWDLACDNRLRKFERSLLLMTFDNAYIKVSDFDEAILDIEEFISKHHVTGHWRKIIDAMQDTRVSWSAMGFHMNSCGAEPFSSGWNDDLEIEIPFDWSLAFSVY